MISTPSNARLKSTRCSRSSAWRWRSSSSRSGGTVRRAVSTVTRCCTNTEAQEGKARCTDEMRAAKYLSDARMAMLRGRFDEAANLVEQGLALTRVQKDLFEGMQARVREAHLNRMYNDALSFERDLEYEKAVDKYGEILGETDYYKDVLARKDTLEQYIRLAAELYDKAQAATSKDEKIRLLEQIRLIWPEYKDTSEQLKALSTP